MAFTTISKSQTAFLEGYMRGTGREMSASQASATYGIQNLRARISELRSAGLRIRKSTNSKGKTAYAISRRDVTGSQAKLF